MTIVNEHSSNNSATTFMTVIREGSSSWGDVIASLDGDQVLEGDSMIGDVVVHIDDDLRTPGCGPSLMRSCTACD